MREVESKRIFLDRDLVVEDSKLRGVSGGCVFCAAGGVRGYADMDFDFSTVWTRMSTL